MPDKANSPFCEANTNLHGGGVHPGWPAEEGTNRTQVLSSPSQNIGHQESKGSSCWYAGEKGSVEDREPWQPAGENVHYSGYCRLAQGIFTETKGTLFRAHLGWAFTSKTSSQDTLEKLHIHFNDSPVHSS